MIEINERNFPDTNFRNYVIEKFSKDKDGFLSEEEIAAIPSIMCSDRNIASLQSKIYH